MTVANNISHMRANLKSSKHWVASWTMDKRQQTTNEQNERMNEQQQQILLNECLRYVFKQKQTNSLALVPWNMLFVCFMLCFHFTKTIIIDYWYVKKQRVWGMCPIKTWVMPSIPTKSDACTSMTPGRFCS
jgi:hypothetical protein